MKILILGGTMFLGRHLVDAALAAGHEVTLFNRGRTNPSLFPDLETITGDREHDVEKLAGRTWDAAVDTSGYVPRIVRLSAEALKGGVKRYVFISSISVYADFQKVGIDESYPVGRLEDETVEEVTGETYGPLKVLCERAVQEVYGERALVVRPGVIVGPYDPTDRFTYWVMRIQRGGDVIVPAGPNEPVQIVDAGDLSEFIVRLIEENASGVFNATGPETNLTLGELIDACRRVSGSVVNLHWASLEFLEEQGVKPWSDMPLWVPGSGEYAGLSRVDVSRAVEAGLKFRPLEDTVRDTLQWARMRPEDHTWRAGLSLEKEQNLLTLLKRNDP